MRLTLPGILVCGRPRRRFQEPAAPQQPTLLGDPDFNTSAPTFWDGAAITGDALTYYNGFLWWMDSANWGSHGNLSVAGDGGLDDLALSDNLYVLGRDLRDRMQAITIMQALTRDLRMLDTLSDVLDLAASTLAVGYRGTNPAALPTTTASPYLMWPVRGSGFGNDEGTDQSVMNEVKWHAIIAQVTYALYLNRNHTSPGNVDYAAKYNYWMDYLTNHFVPKWSGGGTSGWRNDYRGVRRTPTYDSPYARADAGAWPLLVNGGEMHSSVSSTHLAYYMNLLTGNAAAATEHTWMSDAFLDTDMEYETGHAMWPHTSQAQGSTAHYAQGATYVPYTLSDMTVARVLRHYPTRINDSLLTQMMLAYSDYMLRDGVGDMTDNGDIATFGDIAGEVLRAGFDTSSPTSDRTTYQVIINPHLIAARWAPAKVTTALTGLMTRSFTGTVANPNNPYLNTASFLALAPL